MAKLKRLNRSDRAKYNAKLGDIVGEISKSSGIIATKSGESFAINDSADAPISGLKIYGRTDQVKTSGANLFDVHNAEFTSANNRASAEVLDDGTVRAAVSKSSDYINVICSVIELSKIEGNTVYISADVKVGSAGNQPAVIFRMINSETGTAKNIGSSLKPTNGKISGTVTISDTDRDTYDTLGMLLYYNASSTYGWEVGDYVDYSNIMISTSDVPYEPYTGLEPSPSPEYPQKMNVVQSGKMNLSIANGSGYTRSSIIPIPYKMRGMPVPSGGNVTDENGQQWICDEIDTDAKELIVRIGEAVSSSGNDWGTNSGGPGVYYLNNVDVMKNTFAMCEEYRSIGYSTENLTALDKIIAVKNYISIKDSRFASIKEWVAHIKAHPIKIQYVLAEPIRIPLDDVYNLSTLQTYKPTTVVSNDAGAIVELSYYADKKNYIDQKFAELQALALENK